jgi:hypothetical protein
LSCFFPPEGFLGAGLVTGDGVPHEHDEVDNALAHERVVGGGDVVARRAADARGVVHDGWDRRHARRVWSFVAVGNVMVPWLVDVGERRHGRTLSCDSHCQGF